MTTHVSVRTEPVFNVGQPLLLRQRVRGYPRGTAVKVVRVVDPAAAHVYLVEPHIPEGRTSELTATGVTLMVGIEELAESLPEFRSGRLLAM